MIRVNKTTPNPRAQMTAQEAASEILLLLCSEFHLRPHRVFRGLWSCQPGKCKKVLENLCCREPWLQMKLIRVRKFSLPGKCLINTSYTGTKALPAVPACLFTKAATPSSVWDTGWCSPAHSIAHHWCSALLPSVGCSCIIQPHHNVLLMPIVGNLAQICLDFSCIK